MHAYAASLTCSLPCLLAHLLFAGTHVDHNVSRLVYEDFINKELILFSIESNKRAIPSIVDGLKPGQRKAWAFSRARACACMRMLEHVHALRICTRLFGSNPCGFFSAACIGFALLRARAQVLFACFKRSLTRELKVAQLAGYVAENSAYHHGEASLHATIVNMAQNFVGANNVNFLWPAGQFGTRAQGGKDHASARYIFTHLSPVTRHIFHADDDNVLTYLNDDGQDIEPEFYVPVIPTVLVRSSRRFSFRARAGQRTCSFAGFSSQTGACAHAPIDRSLTLLFSAAPPACVRLLACTCALRCVALRCVALRCVALRCVALRCTACVCTRARLRVPRR
jgi:hypothetical protein